mmetsp:Transcript_2363/g.5760  ORF Transcript_2363/g.5760 Transcript_2363/m.5760 type:complete len:267 (+) Transcript_2363:675-1475(+)
MRAVRPSIAANVHNFAVVVHAQGVVELNLLPKRRKFPFDAVRCESCRRRQVALFPDIHRCAPHLAVVPRKHVVDRARIVKREAIQVLQLSVQILFLPELRRCHLRRVGVGSRPSSSGGHQTCHSLPVSFVPLFLTLRRQPFLQRYREQFIRSLDPKMPLASRVDPFWIEFQHPPRDSLYRHTPRGVRTALRSRHRARALDVTVASAVNNVDNFGRPIRRDLQPGSSGVHTRVENGNNNTATIARRPGLNQRSRPRFFLRKHAIPTG